MESYQKQRHYLSPVTRLRSCGIETLIIRRALPQRATSKENVAPGVHPGGGGVNPTVALQQSHVELSNVSKDIALLTAEKTTVFQNGLS